MKNIFKWMLLMLAVVAGVAFADVEPVRPNVLLIFADDLGYGDVGCYGATKLKTPHIDRIAKDGLRFTNAYTPSSTCSQSRVSLLTGRYWWRSPLHPPKGVIAPRGPNALLEKGIKPLPKFFRENGYRTAAFGKWHLGVGYGDSPAARYDWNRPKIEGGPLASGFDYFFGLAANVLNEPAFYIENDAFMGRKPGDQVTIEGTRTVTPWSPDVLYKEDEVGQDTTRKAVEYIESAPDDKPLFLYFASTVPHKPITPGKPFVGSSECGIYGDFVQELDWQVGELIGALRKTGRLDNTLIIFTSDNGAVVMTNEEDAKKWHLEPMWEVYAAGLRSNGELRAGKHSIYEGGSRIPFIVSWPGHIPASKQNEGLFCLTDVFATFADLFETAVPESVIDSHSFWPVWSGKSTASPRETVPVRSSNVVWSFRQGKWKYIERDPKIPPKRKGEAVPQLYDLENDPAETRNVISQYPEVQKRLKKALEKVRSTPRAIKPTGNLLPEGNFSQMQGSRLSPGWQVKTFKKGNAVGSGSVEAMVDSGNPCLKFSCTGGKWTLKTRDVDVVEGAEYTLTLRARALENPVQGALYLISPWDLVEHENVTFSTEWQTYTLSVTADGLSREILHARIDLLEAGTVLIDEITLSAPGKKVK